MNKRLKVDLHDKHRVIITEVLPYELPLWFTNELMYQRIKDEDEWLNKILSYKSKSNRLLPLEYKIKRTGGSARVLSIMHPLAQRGFCNFYEKYKDLITYYCGRSNKSLRYPSTVSKSLYKKSADSLSTSDNGIETSDKDFTNFISFFKYEKYAFLYKYFESYDYNKLEKGYSIMMQVDISRCFNSIYTHSISWAVKNKFISKRDIGKGGFDQEFDKLMQQSNYNETNGILIGSEISRVFAEIILQDIDLKIIKNLKSKHIIMGKDYDFRRYVDDYFVYINSTEKKSRIIEAIDEELYHYKMHLNEAKTILHERPFITEITLCKKNLSSQISRLYENRIISAESGKKIKSVQNVGRTANALVTEIKSYVKSYKVQYASICNYLISVLNKKILQFIGEYDYAKRDPKQSDSLLNWLIIDLDILFFLYSMDPRIVTSDKISKSVLAILNVKIKLNDRSYNLIEKKVFDLCREAIKNIGRSSTTGYSIESVNILSLMIKIQKDYELEESFLEECFYTQLESEEVVYFTWVSIMLYIKDIDTYDRLRGKLLKKAVNFFKSSEHDFNSTEFLMFFADFLACPYFTEEEKNIVAKLDIGNKKDTAITNYLRTNFPKHRGLIVDWYDENWIDKSLEKKIFKYAYE